MVEATENDSCEQSVAVLIVETLCQGVAPSRHSYLLGDDCLISGSVDAPRVRVPGIDNLPDVANEDRAVVQSVINAAC